MLHFRRALALILCLGPLAGCYGLGDDIVAKLGSFTVTPLAGLVTDEGGGTDTFSVVLDRLPSADVVVALSSSDPGEGVPAAPSLTFTPANWNVPQIVTVVGQDDPDDEGDVAYTILLAAAVSADYHYSGIDPADVGAVNSDDDLSGVTVSPTSGLSVSENLTSTTFNVVLDTRPTADVTINLASADTLEVTVSPASLLFTAADWDSPQIVTVTGVDDAPANPQDGPKVVAIQTTAAVSGDPLYSAIPVDDVSVTNGDNDQAGITVTPVSGLETVETAGGATASFTVVLNNMPSNTVVIDVATSNAAEGLVSTGILAPAASLQLTFTPGTWDSAQTVTVTGVDDTLPVVDGPVGYTINVTVNDPLTLDGNYDGVAAADPAVTNLDDDAAGFTVSPLPFAVTTIEGGTGQTFSIALTSIPAVPITIDVTSLNLAEGTVSTSTLTFQNDSTALDPHDVIVSPVEDNFLDGTQVYTVELAVIDAPLEPDYDGLNPPDVTVSNQDNDVPGFTVNPTSISTNESGTTANFSVRLNSIPAAPVTITFSGWNPAEGSLSVPSLSFPATGAALADQPVTVTGVEDAGALDGPVVHTITGTPSGDPVYAALPAFTVTVTNNDNDDTPPGAAPGPGVSALGLGPADAYDDKRVMEPSVIADGLGGYTMWFEGSNATGPKKEQVGLAAGTSPVTWTKDPGSPVLTPSGVNGTIDKNGVGDPCVVQVGPTDFRMWFGCKENAAVKTKIAYATSTDGVSWTKHALSVGGPTVAVLSGTPGQFDQTGVSSPHVINDGGIWKMWYQGEVAGVFRIGYATSTDGITWVKHGSAVLGLGAAGTFDDASLGMPCVLKQGPATYRMWYIGRDDTGPNGVHRLGYAQSGDGISWTKFAGNPILDVGAPGSFDEARLWSPWVIFDSGASLYHIWYAGENDAGLIRLMYTSSP